MIVIVHKTPLLKSKKTLLKNLKVFFIWLCIVDNVRTIIQRQNEYIYIPDLREYANTY